MSSSGTGAVFFLGNRAHYQVLEQPEPQLDAENGNSEEYEAPARLWQYDCPNDWSCCDDVHVSYESDKQEPGTCVKRRVKRRPSDADDEMKPAALNHVDDNDTLKTKTKRTPLLSFLWSLARRKPRLESAQLRRLHGALACTYRESCRCLDCQSRYFECDEEDSSEYSDDSEFLYAGYGSGELPRADLDDYDDEVFSNSIPEDNTSTDLLLEGREKMSISSDTLEAADDEDDMQLEVAAGTPVVLNHLLTHPIACVIQ